MHYYASVVGRIQNTQSGLFTAEVILVGTKSKCLYVNGFNKRCSNDVNLNSLCQKFCKVRKTPLMTYFNDLVGFWCCQLPEFTYLCGEIYQRIMVSSIGSHKEPSMVTPMESHKESR